MDIQGKRFGRLIAIEPVGRNKSGLSVWRCECDCGNTNFTTTRQHLTSGSTKSCGCRAGRMLDISNRRFGMLTVIEPVSKNKQGNYIWRCECDCGNKAFLTSSASLVHGGRLDCGCNAKKEENAFLANKHGMLRIIRTVSRPSEAKKKERYYLCRCDCGNTTVASKSSLKSGSVRSCGCLAANNLAMVNAFDTNIGIIASKTIKKTNTSGVTGVWPHQGKWEAQISFQKKRYYLGIYDSIEEAAKVRREAEERIHGTFLDWYEENIRPIPKRKKRVMKGNEK